MTITDRLRLLGELPPTARPAPTPPRAEASTEPQTLTEWLDAVDLMIGHRVTSPMPPLPACVPLTPPAPQRDAAG